jgi:hypothetical protein
VVVTEIRFKGDNGWPHYGHPESMQTIGNILVLGVDSPLGNESEPMQVLFINVANPENPQLIRSFKPANPEINGGIVAITPRADGRYLLAITGGKRENVIIDGELFDVYNEKIWFYESNPTPQADSNGAYNCDALPASGPTDLRNPCLDWTLRYEWNSNSDADKSYLGQSWPTGKGREHQMVNFLREGSAAGTLYLAGARGGIDVLTARIGDDMLDLYRIDDLGGPIRLKWITSKKMNSHPNADPTAAPDILTKGEANFAAASGFYVSPSRELLFYATEHANGGPFGSVRVGEWRHIDMVRPNSPTLLPSAKFLGPFAVDEGTETFLGGLGEGPLTKAWIQLFGDPSYSDRYVVVDFVDQERDNFENFKRLDGTVWDDISLDPHFGFNDEAQSWRWFAPPSCSVRANEKAIGEDGFPGSHTKTLVGTGQAARDSALEDVTPDSGSGNMDREITSVQILKTGTGEDCDYYSYRPDVHWDLDSSGRFASHGSLVPFNATVLDGPRPLAIPIKAVHPVDGLMGFTTFRLTIQNVAPTIGAWGLFNSLNQQLGIDVAFFVGRIPVTVRASFTDPGRPDTQTASVAWGDGATDPHTAFDSFSDAFGGRIGELSETHQYQSAGNYNLALQVVDDDHDGATVSATVPVLSALQALNTAIAQVNQLLSVTTDPAVRRLLLSALRSLQGSVATVSQNGTGDKLDLPTATAAQIKVHLAIEDLLKVQASGTNTTALIALLRQIEAALPL